MSLKSWVEKVDKEVNSVFINKSKEEIGLLVASVHLKLYLLFQKYRHITRR